MHIKINFETGEALAHLWLLCLASQTFFVGGACGKGKRSLVTHVNILQGSGKTTSELSCGTAHHNDLACGACEKDGSRHAMRKAAK